MSYNVIWSQRSEKDLKMLDSNIRNRIVSKVEYIKEQPFSHVKRLAGIPLYSLRAGDYRVIMDIKNKQMLIFVIKLGHRSRIYNE